jgi:hypothetical protein
MQELVKKNLDQYTLGEIQSLQVLHDSVPNFYRATFGLPPTGHEAEETFSDLPPEKCQRISLLSVII